MRTGEEYYQLIVDLGAKVSVLNQRTCSESLGDCSVSPSSMKLVSYEGSPIKVIGEIHIPVQCGKHKLGGFPFYVTSSGANIMGVDLFYALGFQIVQDDLTQRKEPILQVVSKWQSEWPSLFTGLGCVKEFAHQPMINPDVKPVVQSLRRIPLALRDEVLLELKRLESEGIIEKVESSPSVSNLVVVRKKCGGIHLCVDLRQANKAVVPQKYALSTVEEIAAEFYGSAIFTKLDLKQEYLQVPLMKDSRNLTAFVSHDGVYRFRRMPFGLSSVPSAFQQMMATIMSGIKGASVFMDDIVVHGPTQESHDHRLKQVLQKLTDHKLTLNEDKCMFSKRQVEFLGYVISAHGIMTQRSNVKAI